MRNKTIAIVSIATLLCLCGLAQAQTPQDLLKQAGAVSYSMNESYGAGIKAMYLGYDAAGKPIAGAALRSTKSYKQINTLIAVARKGGRYAIQNAEVTNMSKLPKRPQELTNEALADIRGTEFKDAADAKSLVDSVTGATKYYKAIYVSYSLMASKIIGEMNKNPDWERIPLP